MNVSAGDAFNCRCLNPRPMCRLGAATAQAVPEFQCMSVSAVDFLREFKVQLPYHKNESPRRKRRPNINQA